MSHPLRIDYPNAWHYVMNRGRRGQDLFVDKADYQQFFNKKIDNKDTEIIADNRLSRYMTFRQNSNFG
jgi:hypothetical protein